MAPPSGAEIRIAFQVGIPNFGIEQKSGRPNPRLLVIAGRNLETLTRLLGLQIDLTLNQTNIAIGASSSTAAALAPLDVAAYTEMLASGSLCELNAVPPVSRQPEVLPA